MPFRARVAPSDPVAWARTTKRRQGGGTCTLCRCPDAVRALKAWIPLWKSGEINISHAQATDWLNANTSWRGKAGAFRRCLREHQGYVYGG